MSTWLDLPADSLYGVDALPYASVELADSDTPHLVVRIGDQALDLTAAAPGLGGEFTTVTEEGSLDALLAAGPDTWAALRSAITTWLTDESHRDAVEPHLLPVDGLAYLLPFTVGDYVDFYASEYHATNLGKIFRPGTDPLTPNWKHLPIGYHGRSGTIIVSGEDIPRPKGQRKGENGVEFGPSIRLDIEAELGYVVGVGSERGTSIPVADYEKHVFGVTLVNDWSARDIQSWEYVPLGPFLGKSFATSIGAWVLPLAALEAAKVTPPERTVPLQEYLEDADPQGYDIDLEVTLNGDTISRPPYRLMYWTGAQMLAHTTVNGASTRTGDFYASGTISGPGEDERGALIEITWNAQNPVTLSDGSTRGFLEDGDEIVITATAPGTGGGRIGLGEVRGRITPAS